MVFQLGVFISSNGFSPDTHIRPTVQNPACLGQLDTNLPPGMSVGVLGRTDPAQGVFPSPRGSHNTAWSKKKKGKIMDGWMNTAVMDLGCSVEVGSDKLPHLATSIPGVIVILPRSWEIN